MSCVSFLIASIHTQCIRMSRCNVLFQTCFCDIKRLCVFTVHSSWLVWLATPGRQPKKLKFTSEDLEDWLFVLWNVSKCAEEFLKRVFRQVVQMFSLVRLLMMLVKKFCVSLSCVCWLLGSVSWRVFSKNGNTTTIRQQRQVQNHNYTGKCDNFTYAVFTCNTKHVIFQWS